MNNNKRKYLSCLAAGLFSFYNLFQLSLLNVISGDLILVQHLTTAQVGLFSACFLFANVIGLIPIGYLLDRHLLRKTALFLLIVTTCSSFIIALSYSFMLDCLMRFFQGLASAASLLICIRLSNNLFKNKANFVIGILIGLALLGGVAGNSVFVIMVRILGWQVGLCLTSLLGVIFLIIMWLFLYEDVDTNNTFEYGRLSGILGEIKLAIQKKQNLIAGIFLGFMDTPIFVLATLWGNFYLVHHYALSKSQAAMLSSLIFIGVIVGSPLLGYLVDKNLKPMTIVYLSCSLALLLSLLLFFQKMPLIYIALIFFGLGFFCSIQNKAYSIITANNSSMVISTATSITLLISNAIGGAMQSLFGYILQLKPSIHIINFLPFLSKNPLLGSLTLLPIAFFISLILALTHEF